MYQLPYPGGMFDVVTLHQVLHFAEKPEVDFAQHEQEELREEHAHRRLGFDDASINDWLRASGLEPGNVVSLPGKPLTVRIWMAHPTSAQTADKVQRNSEKAAE